MWASYHQPRAQGAGVDFERLRLKVFFHDRCFDGTASAALFARFYRDAIAPAELAPVGLRHQIGDPYAGVAFDADDHASVDFRFSASPALRWWFDHHRTAFQPPALREVFEARHAETHFFDPAAPSCTGLIARVTAARWGWTPPPALAEVVRWADIIDAAAFATAADAVALAGPAQRLAAFLGAVDDDAAVARYVRELAEGATLDELDRAPWVRAVLDPLIADREQANRDLARVARVDGDVVVFDLLDEPWLPSPGFLGYALHPDCAYSLSATRAHGAIKLAVGFNPWGRAPRRHDIGALCERFGGGGHAVVGGVTLEEGEVVRARETLAALRAALR